MSPGVDAPAVLTEVHERGVAVGGTSSDHSLSAVLDGGVTIVHWVHAVGDTFWNIKKGVVVEPQIGSDWV